MPATNAEQENKNFIAETPWLIFWFVRNVARANGDSRVAARASA
jgi:hypothetical protein